MNLHQPRDHWPYARLVARLQILFAAGLGATLIAAFTASSQLAPQLLGSLKDASAAARRILTSTARQIRLQQQPVALAAASLESFQQTLQAIKTRGDGLIDLLPVYQNNLGGISSWMSHLETTLADTASAINVAVPEGINFKAGWTRPAVTYARPLAVPAQHLRETAAQLTSLRESLAQTDAVVAHAHRQIKPQFAAACEQTIIALAALAKSTSAIPAQLEQSRQDVLTFATQLESMEHSLPAWAVLIKLMFCASGFFAALVGLNGSVVLLLTLAPQREKRDTRQCSRPTIIEGEAVILPTVSLQPELH